MILSYAPNTSRVELNPELVQRYCSRHVLYQTRYIAEGDQKQRINDINTWRKLDTLESMLLICTVKVNIKSTVHTSLVRLTLLIMIVCDCSRINEYLGVLSHYGHCLRYRPRRTCRPRKTCRHRRACR